MIFPLYRKLSSADVYYKINNPENFTETKKMGNSFFESDFTAQIYPDKLRIHEMINCTEPFQEISDSEYHQIIGEWEKNLKKINF